ncbi:hypothetical protein C9374_006590 [Naegleria lovaniensis]|uniref:Uncharacterized protein n=1 Tax=Naegleria lovaniensis TaxID=51637 RepID=A0AA88GJ06_NAELO|nr:uncharacterized protein C9374_006590 [Naegleria lovaniensis]KAG2379473.1 hypothetical protein C9374_006590 [Naegleria lovaniensis]
MTSTYQLLPTEDDHLLGSANHVSATITTPSECPSAMTFDSKIKKQRKTTASCSRNTLMNHHTTSVEQAKRKKKKRSLIEEIVKNTPPATCHSPHLSSNLSSPLIDPTQLSLTISSRRSSTTTLFHHQPSHSTMFIDCSNPVNSNNNYHNSNYQRQNSWTSPRTFMEHAEPLPVSNHSNDHNDSSGDMCQVILTNWKSRSETRQWIKKCINETNDSSPMTNEKKHKVIISSPLELNFTNKNHHRHVATSSTSSSSGSSNSSSVSNHDGSLPTYIYTTCPLPFQAPIGNHSKKFQHVDHSKQIPSNGAHVPLVHSEIPQQRQLPLQPTTTTRYHHSSSDLFSMHSLSKNNFRTDVYPPSSMDLIEVPKVVVAQQHQVESNPPMVLPSFREFVSTLGL